MIAFRESIKKSSELLESINLAKSIYKNQLCFYLLAVSNWKLNLKCNSIHNNIKTQ